MRESYTLKLEGKEWKDVLEGVYKKKKKDIKMDGFRKGNVPYNIYVKNAGIESLFMDASDEAINILYKKLMADEKTITPVATPNIEIKSTNNSKYSTINKTYNNNSVSLSNAYKSSSNNPV